MKESIKGAVPQSCPEEQPKAPKVGVSTLAIRPLGCTQFKVQPTPLRVTVSKLGGKGVREEARRRRWRDPDREAVRGKYDDDEEEEAEKVGENWRERLVSASKAAIQRKRFAGVEVHRDNVEEPPPPALLPLLLVEEERVGSTQSGVEVLELRTLGRVKVSP